MSKKILALFVVMPMLFYLVNPCHSEDKVDVLAVSGSPGGGWYSTMAALGQIITQNDPSINIKPTPGSSFTNIIRVSSNEAQLGFTFPFWISQAFSQTGPFATRKKIQPGSLMAIAGGFGSSPLQIVVSAELAKQYNINTVKDLIDKKVRMKIVVNKPGTHEEWALREILNFYGSSLKDIQSWGSKIHYGGYTDYVQLIKDGHADVMLIDVKPPAGPIVEAQLSRDLKLIPLTKDAIEYMVKEQGHTSLTISSGTYEGQTNDYPTVTMLTVMITNNQMSDRAAYSMVKALAKDQNKIRKISPSLEVFNAKTSWQNLIAPLHPGADKAYKELGFKQ